MNFTHFKRRGCHSVQDQSLWNCLWTEWRRDGFLFDYIGFPQSLSSHQCSILFFILILPLPEGQADEDWEPDIRKTIALLTMNFRIAAHCFVRNTLLHIEEHWQKFFFFHTSKEYSFFLFFLHKISWMFIRFEFYTTVKILFTVFWVLTPCGPCGCLLVFRKSVLCASSGLKCAYVSWWGDCHLCRA